MFEQNRRRLRRQLRKRSGRDGLPQTQQFDGYMPFPVELDFSKYMEVALVVAGDGRHQRVLR